MSEFKKEAEAAEILLAMQGKYQPGDQMDIEGTVSTEEGTDSTEEGTDSTEGNLNINQILFNIKNSSELAREVKQKSFKQLSSWVSNVSDALNHVKRLIEQSRSDGEDLANNYKTEIMKFGTNITNAYRKIEGNVESGLENIGLKEQLDNIMLQHEKMLFIALQLVAYNKNSNELLSSSSGNIKNIVDTIISDENNMKQVMIHVNKLFETFYYGKLGVSAVNSYNIVETDQTIQGDIKNSYGFFARSNKDLIDKYNKNETQIKINAIKETNNLKNFLVHFIRNFKNDGTVNDFDHAKYFGYSQTLPEFVESIIGFNNNNINFIDFEISKNSIKSRLEYYANIAIKDGESLTTDYAPKIKGLYSNYKKLIDETEDFIKVADLKEFGHSEDTEPDPITAANETVKDIREELNKNYNDFINDPEGPIEKIKKKISQETFDTFLTESNYNKKDESKKRTQEQQSSEEKSSKKARIGGNEGGRKHKTRVAANKKRKTQKKKRPSRKMKVSRKKTQRRKKKGSKKKSMKNRK